MFKVVEIILSQINKEACDGDDDEAKGLSWLLIETINGKDLI